MIFAQTSSAVAPLIWPTVAMAPGLTRGFISWPLYCSIASMELKACPVASTPTPLTMVSGPFSRITSARVKTLEIDWIEKGISRSPTLEAFPVGVIREIPK